MGRYSLRKHARKSSHGTEAVVPLLLLLALLAVALAEAVVHPPKQPTQNSSRLFAAFTNASRFRRDASRRSSLALAAASAAASASAFTPAILSAL